MSQDAKVHRKVAAVKKESLGGVLKKNESIKKNVRKAADEITVVNDVLKQEKTTVKQIKQADSAMYRAKRSQ